MPTTFDIDRIKDRKVYDAVLKAVRADARWQGVRISERSGRFEVRRIYYLPLDNAIPGSYRSLRAVTDMLRLTGAGRWPRLASAFDAAVAAIEAGAK